MDSWNFHPGARAELLEAGQRYALQNPIAARNFGLEVGRAIRFILAHPEASPKVAEKAARRKVLSRFPYSLIYKIKPDHVRILAVAHHKRRSDYWAGRL